MKIIILDKMKKLKRDSFFMLFVFIFIIICVLSFSGCVHETSTYINMEGTENNTKFKEFIEICEEPIKLVYDPLSYVVYIDKGDGWHYPDHIYTPYYASNGLPYLYNPSTNTLEMINTIY